MDSIWHSSIKFSPKVSQMKLGLMEMAAWIEAVPPLEDMHTLEVKIRNSYHSSMAILSRLGPERAGRSQAVASSIWHQIATAMEVNKEVQSRFHWSLELPRSLQSQTIRNMVQAIHLKIEFHRNLKIQTTARFLLEIWTSKPIWREWLEHRRRVAQSIRTPGVAGQAEVPVEIMATQGRSTLQMSRLVEAEVLQVQAARTSRQRTKTRSYLSISTSLHSSITWC